MLLPPLINAAEQIFAGQSGGLKKSAVVGAAQIVLTRAGATPEEAPAALISGAVENHLAAMKADGVLLPAGTALSGG